MPDQQPAPGQLPQPAPEPQPTPKPALDLGPGVGISVQQDMAAPERKLPPAKTLLMALAVLAVAVAIGVFLTRAKPQGSGAIENIAAVEIPGQDAMLVAITVHFENVGARPLWVHTVQGKLKMAMQEYTDDAASAVDYDRYFAAFPALRQNSLPAILPETKIPPGQTARGTLIVSFPVKQTDFDKRQSISAIIQPYDQPLPIVLTK